MDYQGSACSFGMGTEKTMLTRAFQWPRRSTPRDDRQASPGRDLLGRLGPTIVRGPRLCVGHDDLGPRQGDNQIRGDYLLIVLVVFWAHRLNAPVTENFAFDTKTYRPTHQGRWVEIH